MISKDEFKSRVENHLLNLYQHMLSQPSDRNNVQKIVGARYILQFLDGFNGKIKRSNLVTKDLDDPKLATVQKDGETAMHTIITLMSDDMKKKYEDEIVEVKDSVKTTPQKLIDRYLPSSETTLRRYIQDHLKTQLAYVQRERETIETGLRRNQMKLTLGEENKNKAREFPQLAAQKTKLAMFRQVEKYLLIAIEELQALLSHDLMARYIPSISYENTSHIIPMLLAQNSGGNWVIIASPTDSPKTSVVGVEDKVVVAANKAIAEIKKKTDALKTTTDREELVIADNRRSRISAYEYHVDTAKERVADLAIAAKVERAALQSLQYRQVDQVTIMQKQKDLEKAEKDLALAEAELEKAELQLDNATGGGITLRNLRGYTPGAIIKPLTTVEVRRTRTEDDIEKEKEQLRYAGLIDIVLHWLKVLAKLILGVFGVFAAIACTIALILSFINGVIRGVLFDKSISENDRLGIIVNYLDSEYPGIPKPTFSPGEMDRAIEFYTQVAVSTERARWGRTFVMIPFMDQVYRRFVFLPMAYFMLKQYMFLLPGPMGELSDFLFFGIEWSWNLIVVMMMLQLLLFSLNGITRTTTGIVSMLSGSIAPWISLLVEKAMMAAMYSVGGLAVVRAGACWVLAPTSTFFSGSSASCPRFNPFVPSSRAEIAEKTLEFNSNHEAYCATPQAGLCSSFAPYEERHVLTQGDQKGKSLLIVGKCSGSIISCNVGTVISEIRN
jgi:hypothetical protein